MKLKTIRFNLKFFNGPDAVGCDSASSLAELRECFNLNDLYEYFKSGQLIRWLECHDEKEVAQAVAAIGKPDEGTIARQMNQLFDALGLGYSKSEREDAIAAFLFPREIQARRKKQADAQAKTNEIVSRDIGHYTSIINDLIANANSFAKVKAGVHSLLTLHGDIFKLDYFRFYEVMVKKCPLAIFAVLMDSEYGKYFKPQCEQRGKLYAGDLADVGGFTEKTEYAPARALEERLCDFLKIEGPDSVSINGIKLVDDDPLLSENGPIKRVKDFSGGLNGWQDVVFQGRRVMVLCNDGVEVRPYHDTLHQYKDGDANCRFKVFDGLEFRTVKNYANALFYMEV